MNLGICIRVSAAVLLALSGAALGQSASAEVASAKPAEPSVAPPATETTEAPTRVYVVPLRGELGRDVTATPMGQVIDDAKRNKADIIVFRIDLEYVRRGEKYQDFLADDTAGWQTETVRHMSNVYMEKIEADSGWEKKPKIVMWIKHAMGGAAIIPFTAKDVYFTSDGIHGGLGNMEHMHKSVSSRVNEKMFSATMGRLQGMCLRNGHEPKLLMAMARTDYTLSVNWVGGKPEYHEDMTGADLLTDDGDPTAGRRDSIRDLLRFEGNDWLTLRPDLALKLGFSKGTVDTIGDMMFDMGLHRNYKVLEGKENRSAQIFQNWSREISDAEDRFFVLWREYNAIRINGETATKRNEQRGARMSKLKQIQSMLMKYKEAINPRTIQGAPDNWDSEIDVLLEQIRQAIRQDK